MATYASDGSQADVQAKIDLCVSGAGDIVTLPIGTFIWSTVGNGVTVNAIDGITIIGAGIGQTIIDDRCDGSTLQALFLFTGYYVGNKQFRLSGIQVNCHATLNSAQIIHSSAPWCVIDHIKILDLGTAGSTRGIHIQSTQGNVPMANALITNCEIYGRTSAGSAQMITVQGNDLELAPTVAAGTQSSWYLPAGMGGSLATFVENCILHNTHAQDSTIETYVGGRVVVRYCDLKNFTIGAHGNDSSARAGHTIEVYENDIEHTGDIIGSEVYCRGGTVYYHSNRITKTGGVVTPSSTTLQLYRAAGAALTNNNPRIVTLLTAAGNFVVGRSYTISVVGTTTWTAIGAASNTAGVVFTATGVGSGTGTASNREYVRRYDFVVAVSRYECAALPGAGNSFANVIVSGREYRINFAGSTNWVAIGASANTSGVVFTATGAGGVSSGTCTETERYFAYTGGEWRLYGDGLHQLTHPGGTKKDVIWSKPGAYVASGSGDIVISSGGVVDVNLLNGAELVDGNTAVTNGSGTFNGSPGSPTLFDSTKSWTTNEHLGFGTAAFDDYLYARYIWNRTTGAGAFITANDATTVTAALGGGTRQTWDAGDSYVITNGYPGLDMVGRAGPTRFYDTAGVLSSSSTNVRYCTQVLTPIYVWDNTYDGSPDVRAVAVTWDGLYDATTSPRISELIVEDREYYNNAGAPPGYTPYTYPHPDTPTSGTLLVANVINVGTMNGPA